MIYSHAGTRGGQTTHHTKRVTTSAGKSQKHLVVLYADRERLTGWLKEAQAVDNTERIREVSGWLDGVHRAIEQHEAIVQEARR